MSSLSLSTAGVLGGSPGLSTEVLGAEIILETPTTAARAELLTALWLLDLEIAGQVMRYALRDEVVTDVRGQRYIYRSGLADFSMTLDGLQESQGLAITDRTVDWALLARRGANVGRAKAVLRYWDPGQVLEGAIVALLGTAVEPEYGSPDAPDTLTLTLKADATTDRIYPSEQARVDTSTWDRDSSADTYDEQIEGAVYPTVFGYPGEGDAVVDPPVPAMPALLVKWNGSALDTGYLLLGNGTLDCVGGQAYVRDVTADSGAGLHQEWLDVIETTDNMGQVVTVAEVPPGSGVADRPGHAYYFGLSRDTGRGGGTLLPDSSAVLQTLADVCLFALRNSGRQVDLRAQEAERIFLDRYSIDGMLNDFVELVPWLEGELMPLFPIVRARTRHGIYWRFLNWWATDADAQQHLDADLRQVVRTSSVREPESSIANWFAIEFQLNQDRTGARRTLTGKAERPVPWWDHPEGLDDDRIVGSPVCARSQAVYDLRQADVIRTAYVWKETTAISILEHLAIRDAFPRRPVTYVAPAREVMHLQRGDVVTVTDSEVHFDRDVALVDGIQLSGGRLATVALEVLDRRRF